MYTLLTRIYQRLYHTTTYKDAKRILWKPLRYLHAEPLRDIGELCESVCDLLLTIHRIPFCVFEGPCLFYRRDTQTELSNITNNVLGIMLILTAYKAAWFKGDVPPTWVRWSLPAERSAHRLLESAFLQGIHLCISSSSSVGPLGELSNLKVLMTLPSCTRVEYSCGRCSPFIIRYLHHVSGLQIYLIRLVENFSQSFQLYIMHRSKSYNADKRANHIWQTCIGFQDDVELARTCLRWPARHCTSHIWAGDDWVHETRLGWEMKLGPSKSTLQTQMA